MTTPTATSADDITWADFTDAGIDTDLITRRHTELGEDEYVWLSPDKTLKVAVGPAIDVEDRTTLGWDAMTYEWVADVEAWQDNSQEWFGTVPELLAWMARVTAS